MPKGEVMKPSKIIALFSFVMVGANVLTACESTETNMPMTNFLSNTNKKTPEKARSEDRSNRPQTFPSSAVLRDGSGEIPLAFNDLDVDGNGSVNQQEANNFPDLKQKWRGLDQNMDGRLNKEEFSRFEQEGIDQRGLSR